MTFFFEDIGKPFLPLNDQPSENPEVIIVYCGIYCLHVLWDFTMIMEPVYVNDSSIFGWNKKENMEIIVVFFVFFLQRCFWCRLQSLSLLRMTRQVSFISSQFVLVPDNILHILLSDLVLAQPHKCSRGRVQSEAGRGSSYPERLPPDISYDGAGSGGKTGEWFS